MFNYDNCDINKMHNIEKCADIEEKRKKLIKLNQTQIDEYQLKIIKKQEISPSVGDIFRLITVDGISLNGIVLECDFGEYHTILIFKENIDLDKCLDVGIKKEDLLIPPQMVKKEYWSEGYFYNERHINRNIKIEDYGYCTLRFEGKACSINSKYYNKYLEELEETPKIIGMRSYMTLRGLAREIQIALIVEGRI